MTDVPTFLILEGLLHERGTFEVLRGYEDARVEFDDRRPAGALAAVVNLLDANGQVLTSAPVDIRFPTGCGATSVGPGAGLVRCILAHQEGGARLELRIHDRVVYTAAVGDRPPATKVQMRVKGDEAFIDVATEPGAEVQIVAALADGRRLTAGRPNEPHHVVALRDFEGLGSSRLIVEASAAFRTARVVAGEVKLPPATITGHILEPAPGARLPYGQRRSLIGNLSDRNGRRIEWSRANPAWLINGQALERAAPLVGWLPDGPGEYRIELVRHTENRQIEVLDHRTVSVSEPTAEQKEYAAALAAVRHRRGSPQP